jgi:F420-0:gamma-glutamyl ligase
MAEIRISREQLQQAVADALKRIPDRDLIINGPVTVGIIAYPEGQEASFQDIKVLPREQTS